MRRFIIALLGFGTGVVLILLLGCSAETTSPTPGPVFGCVDQSGASHPEFERGFTETDLQGHVIAEIKVCSPPFDWLRMMTVVVSHP